MSIVDPKQVDEIRTNILRNIDRDVPSIKREKDKHAPLIIVGGGPSLAGDIETIRAMKGRIVCMNDACLFLIEHGIKPWGVVFWEAATSNDRFFDDPPDLTYLVASHAHPDAFDKLNGRRVLMWHAHMDVGEVEIVARKRPRDAIIGGGNSAALRTIEIGRYWGYRKFHLFGVDSSSDDRTHAYTDHLGKYPAYRHYQTVEFNGRTFQTVPYWGRQALCFKDYYEAHRGKVNITVHGDGLLPHLARSLGCHAEGKHG